MKPFYTCLIFSAVILFLTTLVWWLFFYSGINIPEYIPYIPSTPISIYGLVLFAVFLTFLIIALKIIFRVDVTISILRLSLWGGLIMLMFQSVFQAVLSTTYDDEKAYHYFNGVITMTLLGLALSFFIAFQLKTKKTGMLVGMIVGICILLSLVQQIFPTFLKT